MKVGEKRCQIYLNRRITRLDAAGHHRVTAAGNSQINLTPYGHIFIGII